MTVRSLVCLCCCLLLPTQLAAESWSGGFVLEERWESEAAPEATQRELQALITDLDARIDQMLDDLVSAKGSDRHILLQDLSAFRAERQSALRSRGGKVVLGRWACVLRGELHPTGGGQALLKFSDGEAHTLIDRHRKTVTRISAEGRDRSDTPRKPNLHEPSTEPGKAYFEQATHRHVLEIDGVQYRCDVIQGWPNPFAVGLRFEHGDAEQAKAFGRLPGMPVRIIGAHAQGTYSLRIVDLERREVAAAELALPLAK